MNDMTKAVQDIMDRLDKSKIYKIDDKGNDVTIEIITYNAFGSLNYAMMCAGRTGLGFVNFPYEVKLSFTIEKKFAQLIEKEIREYRGNIKNYHDKIAANYTNIKPRTCKCSTQQLMVKGCTCGGI